MFNLLRNYLVLIIFASLNFISINVDGQVFKWAKTLGGSSMESANKMIWDKDGNILIVGEFRGTVDFDPGPGVHNLVSAGYSDIFLLKLDASGNYLWSYSFGSTGSDYAPKVKCDLSGNIYVVGAFTYQVDFDPGPNTFTLSSLGSNEDGFILKLSPSGSFIYAKSFGGSSYDFARAITFDSLNNAYITGSYLNQVDFDPGPSSYTLFSNGVDDIFILKLDSMGNFKWAKSIGSSGNDYGYDIKAVDGGLLISGSIALIVDMDPGPAVYNLTSGAFNSFIMKLDYAGSFMWAKVLFGASNDITTMETDKYGNIFTGVTFGGGTVDFDPGSGTQNVSVYTGNNAFLLKLNSSGNFVYVKQLIGRNNRSRDIKLDDSSNIYIAGTFDGTTDFDPGIASYSLSSVDTTELGDVFFLKLDSLGNFKWAKSIGGYSAENVSSILLDNAKNIIAVGSFTGTVDFNPPNNVTFSSTMSNISDVFLIKYAQPCSAPGSISMSNIGKYSGKMNWAAAPGITTYQVRYRVNGTTTWIYKNSSNPYKFLTGLQAGTSYQCQVRSKCSVSPITWSAWTAIVVFTTNPPLVNEQLSKEISSVDENPISLIAYPVPAINTINFELSGMRDGSASLTITNVLGQQVYVGNVESIDQFMETTIDISEFKKGIYFVKITNDSEDANTRIIVE